MNFKKIDVNDVAKKIDPVEMVQNNWYLITVEDDSVANTLTAAWGGLGNLCWKGTATVSIRPQRHTKKFMDASGCFTMTFFDFDKYKPALSYLGSHSGADEPNKIENAGLHLTHVDGQSIFEEGKCVPACKTIIKVRNVRRTLER